MWCCASKAEAKKVLRSAKQQPLQKVTLNLPPIVKLQFKRKWQGKIQATQKQEPQIQEEQEEKPKTNPAKITAMKKKLEEYKKKKKQLEDALGKELEKGRQLQAGLQKIQGMAMVVEYMILKEEQKIDGYVLKIKA